MIMFINSLLRMLVYELVISKDIDLLLALIEFLLICWTHCSLYFIRII